jgi:membrane protein
MLKFINKAFRHLWESIYNTVDHSGIEHAGYIAFLLMLSIFPFLVFFMAIIGFIGSTELRELLLNLIMESSWAASIDALKPRILEITSSPPQGLLTIAILSTLWTASSIFEGLRTILNRAYCVENTPAYLFRRLFSIIEFLCVIVVTLLTMVFLIVLPHVSEFLQKYLFLSKEGLLLGLISPEAGKLRYFILYGYAFFLISSLYYFLPNKKLGSVFYTFPGSIITLTMCSLFTSLFKYYLSTFEQFNVVYGSLAGIIISLVYFYVCSLIFIFGAELNYNIYQSSNNSTN